MIMTMVESLILSEPLSRGETEFLNFFSVSPREASVANLLSITGRQFLSNQILQARRFALRKGLIK